MSLHKREYSLASLLFFIIAMLVLGTIDQVDQQKEDKEYCQMVRDGHWPDYKHIFIALCKENKHESR